MNLNSDSFPKQDLLDRKNFAKRIASGLVSASRNQTEGFVTALTGKWGSGKTSLLEYVRLEMNSLFKQENLDASIIEFNPWMFTDAENIKRAFLSELILRLTGKKIKWKKTFFKWTASTVKVAGANIPGLEKLGEIIGEKLISYVENDTSLAIKKQIDEELIKADKKLFIFIDDIDRLYPRQVFEILQVLKLTGSFKNIFYVLAYDKEAVEVSIETQFKDYGKKFLDKIVQADFVIPAPSDEKIESIFFRGLDDICTQHKINYNSAFFSTVWLHRGGRTFFITLRDVYRFFNSIQFSLPLIPPEVNITDFLVLEIIRLHDFDTYQKLYDDLIRSNYFMGGRIAFTSEDYLKDIPTFSVKTLVQYLFTDDPNLEVKSQIRLRNLEYFETYFTLKTTSRDIPELDFDRFMEYREGRISMLSDLNVKGRLDNLLIRLTDKELDKQSANWDFRLVEDLFKFFDNSVNNLSVKPQRVMNAIVNLLSIRKNLHNSYFNSFFEMLTFSTKDLHPARIYFLHFMIIDREKDSGFALQAPDFKEFYVQRINKIETSYSDYLKQMQSSYFRADFSRPEQFYTRLIIYGLAKYHSDVFIMNIGNMLNSHSNTVFFIRCILDKISDADNEFRLNESEFKLYFPQETYQRQFIQRVKELDPTLMSEEEQLKRMFLLKYFNHFDQISFR